MFSLRDGQTVELPEAFVQLCSTLQDIRAACGSGDVTPLQLDKPVLRLLLLAAAAPSVAPLLAKEHVITESAVDTGMIAALIDAANFLGHAELHTALCACVAVDLCSLQPLNPSAVRERYSLPDDLTDEAAQAVQAALDTQTLLSPESLGGDSSAPGLAGLALDSLLLIFLHLTRSAAVHAMRLACASWAYAGLEDAVQLSSVRPASQAGCAAPDALARAPGPSCAMCTATRAWLGAACGRTAGSGLLRRGTCAWHHPARILEWRWQTVTRCWRSA